MKIDDPLIVPDVVEIRDMRRHWWITYNWYVQQEVGKSPCYVRGTFRLIEDIQKAEQQFDSFLRNTKWLT